MSSRVNFYQYSCTVPPSTIETVEAYFERECYLVARLDLARNYFNRLLEHEYTDCEHENLASDVERKICICLLG